jgi:hypothetical protein
MHIQRAGHSMASLPQRAGALGLKVGAQLPAHCPSFPALLGSFSPGPKAHKCSESFFTWPYAGHPHPTESKSLAKHGNPYKKKRKNMKRHVPNSSSNPRKDLRQAAVFPKGPMCFLFSASLKLPKYSASFARQRPWVEDQSLPEPRLFSGTLPGK